jgi:hypothetical protein
VLRVATVSVDLILCSHKKNGAAEKPDWRFRLPHLQGNWGKGGVLGGKAVRW